MSRFPGNFLDRVRELHRTLQVGEGGRMPGTVAGPVGEGLEFQDHREYRPGDDLRRVDWSATARLGRPYLKRHRREDSRSLRVLVDATASMSFGAPAKIDVALRSAAAVALLGVLGGARVVLHVLGERMSGPFTWARWTEAREVLRRLEEVAPAGDAPRLESSLEAVSADLALHERQEVWILSDLYEWATWGRLLEQLLDRGKRPVLWHVLAATEIHPALEGEIELRDLETGSTRKLRWDAETRRVYEHRMQAFFEELEGFTRRHALSHQLQRNDADELETLRVFLTRGLGR